MTWDANVIRKQQIANRLYAGLFCIIGISVIIGLVWAISRIALAFVAVLGADN